MKVKTSGNLSLSRAVWTLKPTEPALLEALQQAGHGRILAICLSHRGATSPALAERLLRPNMDALHDPHAMLGMNLAVERLNKAVRDKERIRVVTDYDVDGTTSSLILQATLKILGGQGVSYHIPDRMKEGYGFSVFAAESAAKAGIQLIVTADIGVKDHAAVTRSRQLGMDVLVEVHNREELDRALTLDARLIGVNNRNLKTLAVDLATTEDLAPHVPQDRDIVCESGLKTHEDLLRMEQCGARRFLVGEHLMRQDDIEAATRTLLGTTDTARQSA